MKNTISRLQAIEETLKIKPVPTFNEFKSEWERMDALSRSVFVAEAESGDFDTYDIVWRQYMTAVRSHLLAVGLIDENAKSFKEIAEEVSNE